MEHRMTPAIRALAVLYISAYCIAVQMKGRSTATRSCWTPWSANRSFTPCDRYIGFDCKKNQCENHDAWNFLSPRLPAGRARRIGDCKIGAGQGQARMRQRVKQGQPEEQDITRGVRHRRDSPRGKLHCNVYVSPQSGRAGRKPITVVPLKQRAG